MAQKTILSFFSVKSDIKKEDAPALKEEKSGSDGDSPIKVEVRKKRQRIASSSSEEETEHAKADIKKTKLASKLSQFSAKNKESVSPSKVDVKPENRCNISNGTKKSPSAEREESPESVESEEKAESTSHVKKAAQNDKETKKTEKKKSKKSPPKAASPPPKKSPKKGDSSKDGSEYDPSAAKYDPIKDACWKREEKVPYFALARTLEEIESTSARLKMIDILANFLRSVIVLTPDDLLPSIYLCLNRIGPAYEGLELGLAEQTLIRAISESTGRTFTQIKNEVTETGDLGLVAERSRTSQRLLFKPKPLTVAGMFKSFRDICSMSVVNKKIDTIRSLFVACRGPEARFLIRSLNGKLRIGLAEQSVLQAIAQACAMTPPGQSFPPQVLNAGKAKMDELALILKTTYCECPNYDLIVPVILREGIPALPEHCKITPGIPVKPMLAQPTKGVQEVLNRFEGLEFTCEWKYDGERAQIHGLEDGSMKIYSRNQEDFTSKYPDVINRMKSAVGDDAKSFILDCECVAWDPAEKRILSFQVLSTRKRKNAVESEIKVPVCVFMFDLLYVNGKALVRETLAERRRLLRHHFKPVEGHWHFATSIDTCKIEEVQEFLEDSIKGQCEGLMVKTLKEEATYEIAKRSRNWLKLKKDYLDGVGDTLDLVVMGGYFGKGKRTGTYGGFLIGCYDEDSEEYQTLCKIGTGFSDENLAKHTQFFKDHVIPKAPSYYQHEQSLAPDHWFAPVQVWEVRCADLSLSPVHRAALGLIDPEKGISLRFPRFLRVRDDKKPEEATSARQVADMYKGQEQVQAQGKTAKFNEEDFY